ncbi:thylakoid membrane photosystem I accumulation factor [Synechococcus sp. CCY 0621]|uniref:thylakoid membrane photosystem I accumulation factor n=1 Tax=Synechococcus sp. CCY 0621 TaxID=2815603 RepID=UPI001C23558E|nr:thylakoid membrane photosystem I accumulation factor [Synechococcus sp. CCY 0621]
MSRDARHPLPRSLSRPLAGLWALLLTVVLGLLWAPGEAAASLENDRYDGNIFALYAGNGSLVPPRSSLAQSLAEHRVAVIVYYLDDSSVSKQFSPVVSELQRVWGNAVDLIPLVTDPLQNRPDGGVADPAHYWDGLIPQVVVINSDGRVVFDRHGQVSVDAINAAVSEATGIPMAPGSGNSATLSFNELNSEVVASR